MNENTEKMLKELVPYVIICGIIFMLLPLFMGTSAGFATYLIQLGAFPLTALCCGAFYKYKKKKNNIFLCFVAPVLYALSALLYGMWRASWYTVLIYIAAYFLCTYLGMMIGDVLPIGKKGVSVRDMVKKADRRPRRVKIEESLAEAEHIPVEDPAEDEGLDTSTTEDDIEAILNSIHNRKT